MDFALPQHLFLALNKGRYLSQVKNFPQNVGGLSFATHLAHASEDLPHYHDETHLTYVLYGGVVDKRKTIKNEVLSGELMFFRAGEPHQTIVGAYPTKYFSLELTNDFFLKNGFNETNLEFAIKKNPHTKLTLLKLCKESSIDDDFSNSSVEMLLFNLLESKKFDHKTHPLWINKIVEMLHDNWNTEISVDDLAHAANVHPKTVSKHFPRYFSCTLGEYRRQLKVEKALTMIKASNLSLTEIAYQCGFYDQSHFTSIFKQLTGFRPKQFQKL